MEHETKSQVAQEVGEAEFQRFVDMMDLDVDPKGMDDDDLKGFRSSKRVFLRAIASGRLVVDEKGQPIFSPSDGSSPITFREPRGSAMLARDQRKSGHDQAKLFTSMADFTGVDASTFSKMAIRDLKVCEAITLLFLG